MLILSSIYMFQNILKELVNITNSLKTTNKLLAQIEENLRVPNLVEWAEYKKSKL